MGDFLCLGGRVFHNYYPCKKTQLPWIIQTLGKCKSVLVPKEEWQSLPNKTDQQAKKYKKNTIKLIIWQLNLSTLFLMLIIARDKSFSHIVNTQTY